MSWRQRIVGLLRASNCFEVDFGRSRRVESSQLSWQEEADVRL
jgi:hypothetical protein